MRKSTILSVALILGLFLILQTATTVVNSYSSTENPICSSKGTLSLETTNLLGVGVAKISFDYASNYYDADGDSAPLLVRKGDNSSVGWKFLTYADNTLQKVQESECTGTAKATFVSLLNKILILKVDSAYQLCHFDAATPTAAINPKVLSTPTTGVTTISKLSGYYSTQSKVYVAITDNSSSTYTGKVLSTAYGTESVIFSTAESAFVPVGAWTPLDTTNVIVSTSTVAQYRMREGTVVVSQLAQNKFSGAIYSITGSAVTKLTYTDPTTVKFADYADDLSNYIRVGTTSVFWFHQQTDATMFYTAIIPVAQINSGASGQIESVGLSGNKATILYSNKILYLKIVGDNEVKKIYHTTPSGFVAESEYQYKMVISCFCQLIKIFMCFSSNLNCLIVKKGSDSCQKKDPFEMAV